MKSMKVLGTIFCLLCVPLLSTFTTAVMAAEALVNLGSAANFAALAGTTLTNTGGSIITGDIGVWPGTAITGFPPGAVIGTIHAGDAVAQQAQADLTTAYNDAAGRSTAPITVAGNIGGQTLYPGLYKSTSSLAISSGDLTLDAQGNSNAVFIFQIASALTVTSDRKVILAGGAKSSHIFWQVGSSATFGTTSVFKGNILADISITFNTGATLDGRALARSGAVTLDGNNMDMWADEFVAGRKWVQPPNMIDGFDVPSWTSDQTQPGTIVADDWMTTVSVPIRHIRWWGSYPGYASDISDPVPPPNDRPVAFILSWHAYLPGPPYSMPGPVIQTEVCTEFTEEWYGAVHDWQSPDLWEHEFIYDQDLPTTWTTVDGASYFLNIQAVFGGADPPIAWGWKNSEFHWNDDAVVSDDGGTTWTELGWPIGHRLAGQSMDMAFELWTATQVPTPTPTETPVETPTPIPTETPVPTPTPWTILFDFVENCSDWTTATAAVVMTPPDFLCDPGYLRIFSTTNTNAFGYWKSPDDAVTVSPTFLYRARFNVLTDESDQALVPQIRLRANSLNLQQTDYLTIESTGNGAASPTTTGTDYDLYFVPPSNDINMIFAFDLLNFSPEDSATAGVSLHQVTVDRFALDSLTTPTMVKDYTFDTSADGWTSHAAAIVFTPPIFSNTSGALVLEATNNTGCFGYWQNADADIVIAPEVMYRGTFTVRTDVTSQTAVPQMRQRFNAGDLQASCVYGVESIEGGENSPTTTNTTYDKLYWAPPASAEGAALLVSFDMLNFTPIEDAADGQLILDGVMVEALDIPTLP